MDDYVKHPGHYVTIQGKRYFEMTLTHIDWWQSYQFYHQNTKLQHEVIYENSDTQEATVRIPVEEDTKEIEARIHIVIPELNYDHHYTTYIVLGVKHPNETDDSQSDTSAENVTKINISKTPEISQYLQLQKNNKRMLSSNNKHSKIMIHMHPTMKILQVEQQRRLIIVKRQRNHQVQHQHHLHMNRQHNKVKRNK